MDALIIIEKQVPVAKTISSVSWLPQFSCLADIIFNEGVWILTGGSFKMFCSLLHPLLLGEFIRGVLDPSIPAGWRKVEVEIHGQTYLY